MDKLTEITTRQVDGKLAPEFDTFIWGWGGDPYDPSALLELITTDKIGGSSDSFYSNPEYDRLFKQQTGEFDADKRKELIRQMVDLTQRDLPYLVLTEDPIPAGVSHRQGQPTSSRRARSRDGRPDLPAGLLRSRC